MSSNLKDVLNSRGYSEPPEIQLIKNFVKDNVGVSAGITLREDSFIIRVPHAAAAGTLRFQLNDLKTELKTKKRLIIRIGS